MYYTQLGLRHKRILKKRAALHKNPHFVRTLNRITLFVGLIAPLTAVPQILLIYRSHSATDVSLVSWILAFIIEFPWIIYGLTHKDRTIIVSFVLWAIVDLIIVIGIVLYQ